MFLFRLLRPSTARWVLPAVIFTLPSVAGHAASALRPAEISYAQSIQAPYRYSGRVDVNFAKKPYIGTASSVRRYTGLTAGHLLYDPKAGFGSNVEYEPALYHSRDALPVPVSFFAVLSGYQAASDSKGVDSDAAFDLDTGYLLFTTPIDSDSLAPWASDPDALTQGSNFLVLGYGADKPLTGEALASVEHSTPYYVETAPALYEDTAYYTAGGMSGGPLYATSNGVMKILAVNVAGTDPSDAAYSDVRVITPDVVPLVTDAEYVHGLITGGVITGKTKIKAGKTKTFSAGVTFADGQSETMGLPAVYGELKLVATGASKSFAAITKVRAGTFSIAIAADAPSGTPIVLSLFRNDAKQKTQTALKALTITVK